MIPSNHIDALNWMEQNHVVKTWMSDVYAPTAGHPIAK
jgi:hypothetical protein